MSSSLPIDCSNYADTNADIAGVGVRVSFYLQAFLLVVLVDRSWEDAPVALWTFVATSFGITLAAIIQREQLSFFQALQLSNLIWLANFGIFFAYSRQKAEAGEGVPNSGHILSDLKVKYGAMFQTLFSMALTIYIWAMAPTFGNQPQCSPSIKSMLFAIEVPALAAGRYIGLTFSSFLTALYMWISVHDLRAHLRREDLRSMDIDKDINPHSGHSELPTVQPGQAKTHPLFSSTRTTSSHVSQLHSSPSKSSPPARRPKPRLWSLDLDPMFVGIMICQIMVFTYFIVSSELLLRGNPSTSNGATQWGFGQILALIVVTPSALSVMIDAMTRHGIKRVSKRGKRVSRSNLPRPLSFQTEV